MRPRSLLPKPIPRASTGGIGPHLSAEGGSSMRRVKKPNPEDDFTCVTIQGCSRGVRIETWKAEVFKALILEVEGMLTQMKTDLVEMVEIVNRAEALKGRPTTDPERLANMYEV